VPGLHVVSRIVVKANGEHPGVVPTRSDYQFVQVLKVIMVPGQQRKLVQQRESKVPRIRHAHHPDRCRQDHGVTYLLQKCREGGIGDVVVEVQSHQGSSRPGGE
jgi:hypothetical protein